VKILVLLVLLLQGCNYDDNVRKYGQGVESATIAYFTCIGTGGNPSACGFIAFARYATGKEKGRELIKKDDNQEVINQVAVKQLEKLELVKKCKWYEFCD
jgi:hypothetical protein